MAGRPFHLICVGKPKHTFIKDGCALYVGRLSQWRSVTTTCVRDGDPKLPLEDRLAKEAQGITQALTKDALPYLLDERGTTYTSEGLADRIRRHDHNGSGTLTFIIGGPYGFAQRLRDLVKGSISLSHLTLPHELAQLLLLEQLYRAETILRKTPYHHAG